MPVPQVMEEPARKQETVEGWERCWRSLSCRTRSKASPRVNECNSPLSRRRSRRARWSCLNECNSRPFVRQNVPQERISERTQIVEVPMPQIAKETVGVVGLTPHERVQQRTAEQFEDLPQHPEVTVKAVTSVPHERVQQRTAVQIEDAPQSSEDVVEAVTLVPREQAQQRTSLSDQEKQLLHSLRNMGRERAMRET